jgi:UDP-N-acetylmuramate: L-alanyl-gamma-D-glutamyl-meso-diaminopimelate ligase
MSVEHLFKDTFSPEIKREFDKSALSRIEYIRDLSKDARIHISGVCGTGTGAVLSLLKQSGFYVSGSDKAFYPPMGDVVRGLADVVYEGFSSDNLKEKPNLVVIGNALSRGNPEVEFVIEKRIPFSSMPEVFSALLIGSREECGTSVVVSGTHGKTTTSSLVASILSHAGKSPGYFIGGVPTGGQLDGSIKAPSQDIPPEDRIVVLEGDEYDSAFFAKYSKFHCYRPDIAVVTNIEFDHGDIFEDLDAIKNEFSKFLRRIPKDGLVVACVDCPNVSFLLEVLEASKGFPKVLRYGESMDADLVIRNRSRWCYQKLPVSRYGQEIEYVYQGRSISIKTKLNGLHNARNVGAAVLVALHLGVSQDKISESLDKYEPVKRRQQIILETEEIVLIEDFAHHPTEVKLTLQGIRDAYPDKKLIVFFEPRSNTSRRAFFKNEYLDALKVADIVFLKEVDSATAVYTGVSGSAELFSVEELSKALSENKAQSFSSVETDQLVNKFCEIDRTQSVIVVMSNGDFGGIIKKITSELQK